MNAEQKLLPCPICGGEAIEHQDTLRRTVIFAEPVAAKYGLGPIPRPAPSEDEVEAAAARMWASQVRRRACSFSALAPNWRKRFLRMARAALGVGDDVSVDAINGLLRLAGLLDGIARGCIAPDYRPNISQDELHEWAATIRKALGVA